MDDEDVNVDGILQKVQTASSTSLLPEELKTLAASFASTRQYSPDQSKSYLTLSLFCQNVRQSLESGTEKELASDQLTRILGPLIVDQVTEVDERSLLIGTSFLLALFHVNPEVASSIFVQEGVLENIMDSVDLLPVPRLNLAVAHLLSEASGQIKSRKSITANTKRWLELMSQQTEQISVAVAAAVALVKLWKGSTNDNPEVAESPGNSDVQRWIKMMTDIVTHRKDGASTMEAVEGLAYLSTDPAIKEKIAEDLTLLRNLFALVPTRKPSSTPSPPQLYSPLMYGILTIVSNLTTYRRRLSEEQLQLQKLKQMANVSKGDAPEFPGNSVFDSDDHVKARIGRLMDANVLSILSVTPSMIDSYGIRTSIGKILLSIIEEKDNRGKVLQSGGAKTLQLVIRKTPNLSLQSSSKNSKIETAELEAVQALAKLSITSSPVHVFGPNVGAMYDVVRPLSLLVQHPSSNQLQRFEGIMALTNLASYNPDLASRIGSVDGLLSDLELLLLEEHVLIRRASMELICNLIAGSDQVFERYSGNEENNAAANSKLQIVLALSDVDDLPTQLAASGTLATLMASPYACRALFELQIEKRRFLPIVTQLIARDSPPESEKEKVKTDLGLIHRGVICIRNFLLNIGSSKIQEIASKDPDQLSALQKSLVELIKDRDSLDVGEVILKPAMEALQTVIGIQVGMAP